jgi:hypothetical protein
LSWHWQKQHKFLLHLFFSYSNIKNIFSRSTSSSCCSYSQIYIYPLTNPTNKQDFITMEANGGVVKEKKRTINGPTNPMVTPLLTDLYQFTMAYAYWKAAKHNDRAVLVSFFFFSLSLFIKYI